MGIARVAHAELGVGDLAEAVGFHIDVLGMKELGRQDGKVKLGCGIDNSCDLSLVSGHSGVHRFGLLVDASDDLDFYAKKLRDHGVAYSTHSDESPGITRAMRFIAPSGHDIELVDAEPGPAAYLNQVRASHRDGIRPLDFDHITLQTTDVGTLMEFLVRVLDFKVSDIVRSEPDIVAAAWCRTSHLHHDVAIIATPDTDKSLHHYAFEMESFDHLKVAADLLALHGVPVETGPGRHGVGGNVYLYFWVAGNRYEFSAEMPRACGDAIVTWESFGEAFSLWGLTPPSSFTVTS